jgi:hypothetical protein
LLARLWRGAPGLRGGVHERGPVDRTAVNHRGSEYAWIFEAATSREGLNPQAGQAQSEAETPTAIPYPPPLPSAAPSFLYAKLKGGRRRR